MADSTRETRYIYADNAATTQLSDHALQAMLPWLQDSFGNPGGIHKKAREAAEAVGNARTQLATCMGAASQELYITSCGTESDNWVLQGAVRRFYDMFGTDAQPHIITSAIEHHAILHPCQQLELMGVRITILPVDNEGHVSVQDLQDALRSSSTPAALVSIMLANNEIGTIQDIQHLCAVAHEYHTPFHTDAVQAFGHIPLDVSELGVDALSISAHKFHGPKGIGALYLRDGFSIPSLMTGGGQERGMRPGTENVASIIGMAAAAQESYTWLENGGAKRLGALRDQLIAHISTQVEGVTPTGDLLCRLPGIASFACDRVDGELLVVLLDRAGVAAATGSACSTGSTAASHVAQALHIPSSAAKGTLRLSLADDATQDDIRELCERVPPIIERARLLSGF